MKDFTDELVDLIIKNEKENRLNKIMNEVTKKISEDFSEAMFGFLDAYYDNYDPTSYVRVYGKKGKYMQNRKPKGGQVSLHAAISRGGKENADIGKYRGKNGQIEYIGGIEFDASKFKDNSMRHIGKGISEWNIVENFLYAGEGIGKGDWRSTPESEWSGISADELMKNYMDNYDSKFDMHYQNALKHNK